MSRVKYADFHSQRYPDEENLTNILTSISGKMGRKGSRVDEIEPLGKAAQTALHTNFRLELSQSVDSETLVEVVGFSRPFFVPIKQ